MSRFSLKSSAGKTQKVVFHLLSNLIFRKLFVNGNNSRNGTLWLLMVNNHWHTAYSPWLSYRVARNFCETKLVDRQNNFELHLGGHTC